VDTRSLIAVRGRRDRGRGRNVVGFTTTFAYRY